MSAQSQSIHLSQPPRAAPTCQTQSVTVVVPVRNEEPYIARTLDQLLAQDMSGLDLEIVVVDGQSTDQTRQIVERYSSCHPELRLLDNPGRLSSIARNLAIRASRGEYVLVVDGHCEIPSRRYYQDLVAAFRESGADCLGRPQPLDVSDATTLQRAIAAARSSWLGHHPDSLIYTEQEVDCPAESVAAAYRRSVFEKVGHFDEQFDACEDCELNYRIDKASLRCRLVPFLAVKYEPRNSLFGLFRQLYRYGRGRVRFMRKHCDTFHLISALRPLLLVVIAGPFVCWAIPELWTPYALAIGVYLSVGFAVSIWQSIRKRDAKLLLWMPAVFVTIHSGAATGILVETFSRRRKKH